MIRRIYFAVSAAMLLAVLSPAPAAHAEQA